jgi:large subunit ribosomal protein L18
LNGQHIADYAGTLKENQEEYKSRFSNLLKNGLKPEDYPAHFEEMRTKISGGKLAAPKKADKQEAPSEEKEKPEKKAAPKEKKEKPAKKEAKEEKKGKKSKKGGKSKKK